MAGRPWGEAGCRCRARWGVGCVSLGSPPRLDGASASGVGRHPLCSTGSSASHRRTGSSTGRQPRHYFPRAHVKLPSLAFTGAPRSRLACVQCVHNQSDRDWSQCVSRDWNASCCVVRESPAVQFATFISSNDARTPYRPDHYIDPYQVAAVYSRVNLTIY